MRLSDLFEKHTDVLYHYTGIRAALSILSSGSFRLAISTGTKVEANLSPPGFDFFLSASRTKTGDYHARSTMGVVFNLDGRQVSSRYRVRPVDYWERAWLNTSNTSESEDRIFSRSKEMPVDIVSEVHISMGSERDPPYVRKIAILCKKHGIPVYVYPNHNDWRFQRRDRALSGEELISSLSGNMVHSTWFDRPVRGINMPGGDGRVIYGRSGLIDIISLIKTPVGQELPKSAEKRLYEIKYYTYEAPARLGVDLANARKPSSKEYDVAVEIISFMRRMKLDTKGLVHWIKDRWTKPKD